MRQEFLDSWPELGKRQPNVQDIDDISCSWARMRPRFTDIRLPLPDLPWEGLGFRDAVWAIESARSGEVVGFHFEKLIQIAHYLYDHQKDILLYFGIAFSIYGHESRIQEQDGTGKWKKKAADVRKGLSERALEYQPISLWLETILFLFPEIEYKVRKYINIGKP